MGPRRQALPRLPLRPGRDVASATATRRWPTPRRAGPARCCTSRTCSAPSPAPRWPPPSTACSAAAARCSSATPGPRPTRPPSSWPASGAAAGRHVVVSAYGSFHGRTLATLHATGQPAEARGLPAAARGLPPRGLERPRRARGGHRPVGRRRAARAGAGRGRGEPGHRRVLPGRAPAVRRARRCCSWSTRCRPASAAPGAWFGFQHFGVAARRRHDGQGARQRRAHRRLLGHGARWPRPSSPATTPPPSAASRSPRPRPGRCSR